MEVLFSIGRFLFLLFDHILKGDTAPFIYPKGSWLAGEVRKTRWQSIGDNMPVPQAFFPLLWRAERHEKGSRLLTSSASHKGNLEVIKLVILSLWSILGPRSEFLVVSLDLSWNVEAVNTMLLMSRLPG